jgi:hypothetical protein
MKSTNKNNLSEQSNEDRETYIKCFSQRIGEQAG